MKTDKTRLDDLIFANRNKEYGAYANRKNYNKYVTWAVLSGVALFLCIISVPVIANYLSEARYVESENVVRVESFRTARIEKKVMELPKAAEQKVQKAAFKMPKPTMEEPEADGLEAAMEGVKNPPAGEFVMPETPVDNSGERIVETPKEPETFIVVEEMPKYPGGDAACRKFLQENASYPQLAKETGIHGKVYLRFVVDENGKVGEVVVLRGIGGGCDEEAVRVVSLLPDWTPGRQSGHNVRVAFNIDVDFILR